MGTYVIDPRIKIPQSMLPPLAAGETEAMRQNVFLHASRSIDVDLFVLGDADTKRSLNMFLQCTNGSIEAKIVRPSPCMSSAC
jgi:7,8-dihydro-6-hydroxymethylpterin-pyrophosphokinase